MDGTQQYQPLSAALQVQPDRASSQQHYPPPYAAYGQQPPATNGSYQHHPHAAPHREEEEEEDDDEEEPQDDDDHHDRDHHSPGTHSSPRVPASNQAKPRGNASTSALSGTQQANPHQDNTQSPDDSKRKPGRPRGSRNRKPRAPPNTSAKAPSNSQHPGFYQYPPPPAGTTAPNQQFYEFQWRALNLCSEFYNAAEELIKAASPIVISQCYQHGPGAKIDPMALIADAKRVCDSLLANPSQLVGQPPPTPAYTTVTSYANMPPPPAPGTVAAGSTTGAASVISNPQSFVMPLGAPAAPYPPQGYYAPPPGYPAPAPGQRYPTAPYYPYAGAPSYYAPPPAQAAPPASSPPAPQPTSSSAGTPAPPSAAPTPAPAPAPAPQPAPAPAAPAPAPSAPAVPPGNLSAFNASTGNAAPGGTQGAWSVEETTRLKQLVEQSRPSAKGDIEWDWVIQQWGNTRTRHQILLKATSLGLKESTTRGTKRRRGEDSSANDDAQRTAPAPPANAPPANTGPVTAVAPATTYVAAPSGNSGVSPGQSSATASNPPSANASPATQPQRPPSSAQSSMSNPNTGRPPSGAQIPWPMPTIAANTPSPVIANSTIDPSRANYYRRPTQPQPAPYSAPAVPVTTSPSSARPPSSHGRATHPYMYSPQQGNTTVGGRRENGM